MRIINRKKGISLFLLLAFLFLRIANAHTYSHFSHDEDQSYCELCEIITTSDESKLILDNLFTEESIKQYVDSESFKVNFCYKTSFFYITLPRYLYNKPPPTL